MSSSLIRIFNRRKEIFLTLKLIQETPSVKVKVIKFDKLINQNDDIYDIYFCDIFPFNDFEVGHTYTITKWDKTQLFFTGTIIKDMGKNQWNNNSSSFNIEFKNGNFHGKYTIDYLQSNKIYECKCYFFNGIPHRYVEEKGICNGITFLHIKHKIKKGRLYGETESFSLYINEMNNDHTVFKTITFFRNNLFHGVQKRWYWKSNANTFSYLSYKNDKKHGKCIRIDDFSGPSRRNFYIHDTTTKTLSKNINGINKIKIF
jgi:hypothetical protein